MECESLQEKRSIEGLAKGLAQVDALPLECDGLTRVISTLMQREGIPHQVCIGKLSITKVGMIPLHWWIVLPDGLICDYRARMWLGNLPQVPHGLFAPSQDHVYTTSNLVDLASIKLTEPLFTILVGKPLAEIKLIGTESK